jgi:cytochrome P450
MATSDMMIRERPAHVDPALVVDWDVFRDPRYAVTPEVHRSLFRFSEERPRGIYWTPHNGGHWLINDHELMFEAMRDPGLFSSTKMTLPPAPDEPCFIPLSLDPPEHGHYRLPLMQAFAPGEVKKLEANVRAISAKLIAEVVPRGRCEFVREIAEPIPVTIFLNMMGLPLDRIDEFRTWALAMVLDDNDARAVAYGKVSGVMSELIRERQANPGDDLVSKYLLNAKIDGRPLTFDELQNYCMLLFVAGLDTLVASITFGAYQLAKDPALQARLRADPSLVAEFIEEVLRCYAVSMPPRTVTRDTEFAGVRLKAGERVLMMLPMGNLDPAAFPDPMRFDIDRADKAHVTFNVGPHRCVGSHLARLEMRVLYEEFCKAMPDIRLDPDHPPVFRPGLAPAISSLPLVWDPPA